MDVRHRVYYLINLHANHGINWWRPGYDNYGFVYESNLKRLKKTVRSLKVRPTGLDLLREDYFQMKISCKKEDEPALVDLLNKLPLTNYIKLG